MIDIFLCEDLVLEISKYLIHTNCINFSLVNKLCQKTVNSSLDSIDEYKFLQDNYMKITSKNFVCNLDIILELNKLTNIDGFYPKYKKHKLYCVKYCQYDILIKIHLNGYLTIHDCVSYENAYIKLNNMLLLLRNLNIINDTPKIKLIRTLSNICFAYSKNIHNDIKSMYSKNKKITFTTSGIIIQFDYFYGINEINVKYKNFKEFYKYYMLIVLK